MNDASITATEFKHNCLKVVDEVNRSGKHVTVTRHGKPVAVLVPAAGAERRSPFGILKGTVLRYDDPFGPAMPPEEWNANR